MEEKNFCNEHGKNCTNIVETQTEIKSIKSELKSLKEAFERDVKTLRDELERFKQFTYGKIDDIYTLFNSMNERTIRIETMMELEFKSIKASLEGACQDRKESKNTFIGKFVYPALGTLITGVVLYFILK